MNKITLTNNKTQDMKLSGFLFIHDDKCKNSTEQKMYRIYEDNSTMPWTLKTLNPVDFPFPKNQQIDDNNTPVKCYSQDTNMTFSSDEIDSSHSYFDVTNTTVNVSDNEEIIINEKVNSFLKWNTEPLNPIQKTEYNDYNSKIQSKNRLLSGLDQNIQSKPLQHTIRDQNTKKQTKSCRTVCWSENVECYVYRLDSSLSTLDLRVEPCKTEDAPRIRSQTHLLDEEYTAPYYVDIYKKHQTQRNEVSDFRNTYRPLNNYISNIKVNQLSPDYMCNQNTFIANKTKKWSSSNRHPVESSERHHEDLNRQQAEYSEWHHENSNRQPTAEFSECIQENSNRQQEYYSKPGSENSKKRQHCNHSEWHEEDLIRQQYQNGSKSDKLEVQARSSTAGNKCFKIENQSCTTKVKPTLTQKHISVLTKESKKSSEKKKSKKDQYKNCKVCGFVYIHDEKSKTDKHETSTGENTRNENSILENATNENTIQRNTTSEEQKQTLRKMFRLKPEDKNVFVMLKLG